MVIACALLPVMVTVACSGSGPSPSATISPDVSHRSAGSAATPTADAVSAAPMEIRSLGSYLPLWPFANEAEAQVWQESYRVGGHQPWHLSADQTALAFVRFLGFGDEINRVTAHTIKASDARVSVGYRSAETGEGGTAAILHLIKIGSARDAPWEVVGTDDGELSLTTPVYGATAASPLLVGGRITGVDESIRVEIRQRTGNVLLGRFCCIPAGGNNTAWSARVPFHGATDRVVTVVASTGGHLAEVERFAVTGFRPVPPGK